MQHLPQRLIPIALLAAPAFGGTEELYRVDRPAGVLGAWGHSFADLGDVDGDGVADFAVGVHDHGGGTIATVHSGADGAHLYDLTVPYAPVFWGMGITAVRDETGDGVPEIAALGARSGDANSLNGALSVFSGADGSVVRRTVETGDLVYLAHSQWNRAALADVDGDGRDEVFCRTTSIGGGPGVSVISTGTGAALYTARPLASRTLMQAEPADVGDRDDDGVRDFALAVRSSGTTIVELRSGATGAWIADVDFAQFQTFFGGSAPFVGIADLDGDGHRDVASGDDFDGRVSLHSTGTGALLREWSCDAQAVECFGTRLVEVADMTGDGHPDLVALESEVFGNGGMRLFGLDPVTGAVVFDRDMAGMGGGYSLADRVATLGGDEANPASTLLVFEGVADEVVALRVLPQAGARSCDGTPNSSGLAARLDASGPASITAGGVSLGLSNAPAGRPVFFAYGDASGAQPFGQGTLCIAGQVGRYPAVVTDASGRAAIDCDLAVLGSEPGATWTFQAVFRDPAGGGAQTSDAIAIQLQP